ncbi:MAG: dihydropteroate synthase, partial [Actinobacteria bacterium]|nr:dihydropteroate synthase [Actinomycetota bacterium]
MSAATRHRPGILAVLNASPDSFSENRVDASDVADLAVTMVEAGADLLDVGAQSLRTDRPEISVDEEVGRLLPVLQAVRDRLPDVALSVDTYRHEVAAAALDVGVSVFNDPSGLRDAQLAEVVAS